MKADTSVKEACVNLQRYAGLVQILYSELIGKTDVELQQFVDDCSRVTNSNCGWTTAKIAEWLLPEAVGEQRRRKGNLQRDAENYLVGPTPHAKKKS